MTDFRKEFEAWLKTEKPDGRDPMTIEEYMNLPVDERVRLANEFSSLQESN